MDDLARKMAEHRGELDVRWDDARERAIDRGIAAKKTRRTERRRAAAAIACVALIGTGGAYAAWTARAPGAPLIVRSGIDGAVELADGSIAIPYGRDGSVRLIEERAELARLELVSGGARFDVTRAEQRTFRVEAGDVSVQVLGTSFVVERGVDGDAERVHVEVMRGRVRVAWAGEDREETAVLSAGDAGDYPPLAPVIEASAAEPAIAVAAVETETEIARDPAPEARTPEPSEPSAPAWRTLARDGQYDAAYAAMRAAGEGAVRDETGELLLAADVARLTRHPDESVAPLRRILERHRADPRSGLAAFTLGRVLLEELGSPREAALAFAEARALDRTGSLGEDALAREVESWSRAGDAARAEERAREYVERYPEGRRTRSVRHLGGIE